MKKSRKYIQLSLTALAVVTAPIALVVSCGEASTDSETGAKPDKIYKTLELNNLMNSGSVSKQHDAISAAIKNIKDGKIDEYKYNGKTYKFKDEKEFLEGLKLWVKEELIVKFPTLIEGTDKSLIDIGNPIKDFIISKGPSVVGETFKIPKGKLIAPKNSHYEFANDDVVTDIDPSTGQKVSHWTNNISNFQRSSKMDVKKGVTFKVRLVANRGYKLAEKREFKITYKIQDLNKIVIEDSAMLKALEANIKNTIGMKREMRTGEMISLIDGHPSGYTKFSITTFKNKKIKTIELVDSKGKPLTKGTTKTPQKIIKGLRNGDKINVKLTTSDPLLVFSNSKNTKIFSLTIKDMKKTISVNAADIAKMEKQIKDSFEAKTGVLNLTSFKAVGHVSGIKLSEQFGTIPLGAEYHYQKSRTFTLEPPWWNPTGRNEAQFFLKIDTDTLLVYKDKLIAKPSVKIEDKTATEKLRFTFDWGNLA